MNNNSKVNNDKNNRLLEIKELLHQFCKKYLDEELEGYAIKLCDNLRKKRKIDILRGKKEIWAASIYVISRLNFLFDKENEKFITAEIICYFFKTNKSTTGNKATQIENECKLTNGAEGYCSRHITDMFSFYQTSEGFIIPKSIFGDKEVIYECANDEDTKEIEKFHELQQNIIEEKKKRKAEINKKNAEKKKIEKNINQLSLFDDL